MVCSDYTRALGGAGSLVSLHSGVGEEEEERGGWELTTMFGAHPGSHEMTDERSPCPSSPSIATGALQRVE